VKGAGKETGPQGPAPLKIDPQFIITLKGKSCPLFAGILDVATKAGLQSLRTTVLQVPTPESGQLAVVMARAEFGDGRVFEDVGDCSPASTSPQLAAASLRLASTRAKGRVLRDAINVGQTMFEELPDLDAGGDQDTTAAALLPKSNGSHGLDCVTCSRELTHGQATFSRKTYGKPLCPTCQKAVFA
jgi:hypothetical protein